MGQQDGIFETRVFWKILARMSKYAFQSFLNGSNFSCRSASSGEEEEDKRKRKRIREKKKREDQRKEKKIINFICDFSTLEHVQLNHLQSR